MIGVLNAVKSSMYAHSGCFPMLCIFLYVTIVLYFCVWCPRCLCIMPRLSCFTVACSYIHACIQVVQVFDLYSVESP